MTVHDIPQPFTNLQLELLKLFARKLPEKDLLEIRRLLAQYFMDKATDLADKVWDEKGLTPSSQSLLPDDPVGRAVRPLRQGVSVEDLVKEQGYKGTDWQRLKNLAKEMDIKEPIEQLLAQLTT